MILARKAVLSRITQRVEFITPVASEIEPLRGRVRGGGGRAEVVGVVVIGVAFRVEDGIPEGAAVCDVVEEAPGEDVFVDAGVGIHCVAAFGGVNDGLGDVRI
jgi:hypothetical protein